MGLLDSLTQDLSNFTDSSKNLYNTQIQGLLPQPQLKTIDNPLTAPSVPQEANAMPAQKQVPVSSYIKPIIEGAELVPDAYHMWKDGADSSKPILDRAININKDVIKGLATTEGLLGLSMLIPGAGEIVGAGIGGYELYKMGSEILHDHPLPTYKGLLR